MGPLEALNDTKLIINKHLLGWDFFPVSYSKLALARIHLSEFLLQSMAITIRL